jgi:membrane protein involved in colicin uptake
MRTHFQGIAILGLLLVSLWGAAKLASPALSEAFDEDGAVSAESLEDTVNLVVNRTTLDAELTAEELERLQFQLLRAGFLDSIADVDGYPGDDTAAAVQAAAKEWGIIEPTDRRVLEHADELYADAPFIANT